MRADSLRVAAVQMDCSGTAQEIEAKALRMIRRAAKLGVKIACLPEHWVPTGIENPTEFFRPFERAAKEFKMYLISGGDFVKEGGSTFVESFLFGPGGVVGSQRKVHLFRREKRKAVAGDCYPVFSAMGTKIGIAICHDLVYPEVVRIFALEGAEVVFSPARIGKKGLYPWYLYVNARSLENRISIVSPNFLSPSSPGGSVIVGVEDIGDGVVYPKVLAKGRAKPKLLVADLDLESTRRLRRQRLRARRVETFSPLLKSVSRRPAVSDGKGRYTLPIPHESSEAGRRSS